VKTRSAERGTARSKADDPRDHQRVTGPEEVENNGKLCAAPCRGALIAARASTTTAAARCNCEAFRVVCVTAAASRAESMLQVENADARYQLLNASAVGWQPTTEHRNTIDIAGKSMTARDWRSERTLRDWMLGH
jgi:hypothetical protein